MSFAALALLAAGFGAFVTARQSWLTVVPTTWGSHLRP